MVATLPNLQPPGRCKVHQRARAVHSADQTRSVPRLVVSQYSKAFSLPRLLGPAGWAFVSNAHVVASSAVTAGAQVCW